MPSCTFIVICIYVQLQETVTVYVIKYLSLYARVSSCKRLSPEGKLSDYFNVIFLEKTYRCKQSYISLQVTRSQIGFYLIYILIHIYLSIITNQTYIYLLLLFTKYSFIAERHTFIQQYYFWSHAKFFCFSIQHLKLNLEEL